MKEGLTYLAVVLDRSGSMSRVKADTIGGFNALLEEQKKAPGECLFYFAQFDDEYEVLADTIPLAEAQPLTDETFVPRGNTALLDAIGRTIDGIGARLVLTPESERPSKVLVMIQTDGCENFSRFYTAERVRKMIQHQREKYSWDFAFIGASEASVLFATRDLGMQINKTVQYAATPSGTANVLRAASAGVANYRNIVTNSPRRADLLQETETLNMFDPGEVK